MKRHVKCSKVKNIKCRKLCVVESVDTDASATILGFLSNQSIVKLQAATGAHYAGSSAAASSIG
ncbi:hypothetical protein PF003_g4163 [Phytophthora fragariae]|nr:hypothetical protein PF003_g4163 [Phytophthora fragariae]